MRGCRVYRVGGMLFRMVYVKGGWVRLSSVGYGVKGLMYIGSFSMGECVVTRALYSAVLGDFGDKSNLPKTGVSYEGAKIFIGILNVELSWQIGNKRFRLPTEVEWEWAARGGQSRSFFIYSGSDSIGEVAWYRDNCPNVGGVRCMESGHKKPNELGLYDMSGNVWEWCSDAQVEDGVVKYVLKGGSIANFEGKCCIDYRKCDLEGASSPFYGFRLVLS